MQATSQLGLLLVILCLFGGAHTQCPTSPTANFKTGNTSQLMSEAIFPNVNGGTITVGWEFLNATAFRMSLLVTGNCGWTGILLGGANMGGYDVIAGQLYSNQVNSMINVEDRFAQQQSTPPYDTTLGGQENVVFVGSSITQTSTLFVFDRLFDTGDQYDYPLTVNQSLTMSVAFGLTPNISQHTSSNVYTATFNFIANGTQTGQTQRPFYKSFHYWTNFICWGIFVDIGIIIARFYQTKSNYMEWHGILMFLAMAISIGCDANIINANNIIVIFDKLPLLTKVHVVIGLIFVSLMLLQIFGGAFLKYKLYSQNQEFRIRQIKMFHGLLGSLIYVFGKTNVAIGVYMEYDEGAFGVNYPIGLFLIYTFFILLRILLECLASKGSGFISLLNCEKINKEGNQHDVSTYMGNEEINRKLLKDIDDYEIRKQFPNIKYVILNDGIYNVTNFSHPGGNFIIQRVVGREIGRFIYGAYGLESTNIKPYNHSVYSRNFLKQNLIGVLYPISIFHTSTNPSLDSSMTDQDAFSVNTIWTLVEKKNFNLNTSLFKFQNVDSKVKVANFINGVQWFGRHFLVQDDLSTVPSRFYTVVLSMSPQWIAIRNSIVNQLYLKSDRQIQSHSLPLLNNYLYLLIQNYIGTNGFSRLIHSASVEGTDRFSIQGPYGRGLQLKKKSSGLHVIVCGGTGIFPFLDLLNFLLLKSVYMASQKQKIDIDWKTYNTNTDTLRDSFGQSFKVRLLAAFTAKEDIEGIENIILSLNKINRDFNLNLFDCILRFPRTENMDNIPTVTGHFDSDFYEKNLGDVKEIEKVWVCGPPAMNRTCVLELAKLGVSGDFVHLI